MTLKERLAAETTAALKAGRKDEVAQLRYIAAAIKQREVDERRTLEDNDVVAVLGKLLKQHEESLAQFRAAGRAELVQREEEEIRLLRRYLPAPLTDDEIAHLVEETISALGGVGTARMGDVMSALRGKLAGRADLREVSARVKTRLGA
jgi:uncharacterized protein YqeY